MKLYNLEKKNNYSCGHDEYVKGNIGFFCKYCYEPLIVEYEIKSHISYLRKKDRNKDIYVIHNYEFDCLSCGKYNVWNKDPLDPNITPMIAELNKKGFETYCSCEGHDEDYDDGLYNNNSYILFKDATLFNYLDEYKLIYPWVMEEKKYCYYEILDENNNLVKIPAVNIVTYDCNITKKEKLITLKSWINLLPNIRNNE